MAIAAPPVLACAGQFGCGGGWVSLVACRGGLSVLRAVSVCVSRPCSAVASGVAAVGAIASVVAIASHSCESPCAVWRAALRAGGTSGFRGTAAARSPPGSVGVAVAAVWCARRGLREAAMAAERVRTIFYLFTVFF